MTNTQLLTLSEELLFQSVLERCVYKCFYQNFVSTENSAISPYNYFRFHEKGNMVYRRSDGGINEEFLFSNTQKEQAAFFLSSGERDNFEFGKYIIEYDSRYQFLFNGDKICFPEDLTQEQISFVEDLIQENPLNLFAQQAYVVYRHNKGRLDLDENFKIIFQLDPDNPYFLARYARYIGSALYKIDYNPEKLKQGEEFLLRALELFGEKAESFFYSWLANIYIEQNKLFEALKLLEKTISLNEAAQIKVSDPYYWKALVLNKIKKYRESLDICLFIEGDEKLNRVKDFRFFRIIASNYLELKDYKKFQIFLLETIKVFFLFFHTISLTYKGNTYIIGKQIGEISFPSKQDQNSFDSFLKYLSTLIEGWEKIIIILAYFYKERLIGEPVEFNGSRNLEALCFIYLELFYENKLSIGESI